MARFASSFFLSSADTETPRSSEEASPESDPVSPLGTTVSMLTDTGACSFLPSAFDAAADCFMEHVGAERMAEASCTPANLPAASDRSSSFRISESMWESNSPSVEIPSAPRFLPYARRLTALIVFMP